MKRLTVLILVAFLAAGTLAAQTENKEEFFRLMEKELQNYGWQAREWQALKTELEAQEWGNSLEADPELVAFSLELARREMREMEDAYREKNIEVQQTMHRLQARIAREIAETSVELRNMGVDQRIAVRSAVEGTRKAAEDVTKALALIIENRERIESTTRTQRGQEGDDTVVTGSFGTIRISPDGSDIEINGQNRWQFRETLRESVRSEVGQAMAQFDEKIMEQVRTQLRTMLKGIYEDIDRYLDNREGLEKPWEF